MAEDIKIVKVENKKQLKIFIHFPWKIYRGEKNYENWVPPLLLAEKDHFDKVKNPFYMHADRELFLAYRGSEVVGRIAAIIDQNYIEHQKDESGFFGFFETIDDLKVSSLLFEAAESWVKSKGYRKILGPMNPSTGSSIGVLLDSYDIPPIVQMPYNAEYYPALIDNCGYSKAKDLRSYRMNVQLELSPKIIRVSEIVKKRYNITIRTIDMKDWDNTLEMIRTMYNDAWSGNWGFTPWTKEEFDHLGKDLKMIADPNLVFIAYMGDEPVGFTIPLPDMNQVFHKMNGRLFPTGIFKLLAGKKKIDMIRTAILGVVPSAQNKGIDALLVREIYETGKRMGMKGSELSWILEDNLALVNLLEGWGAEYYRTYRIYEKNI